MKTIKVQRKILFFFIAIIFTPVHLLLAQSDNIRFHHLSIEDGLSQNTGFCILQDSTGFIWIGTETGLNKYDGYTFTVFTAEAGNTNSLSNNSIKSICQDHDGIFWIGTEKGLNKFNPATNHIIPYVHDPDNANSISNNTVLSLCVDKAGIIWIGTGGGLNRYDRDKEDFIRFTTDPNNLYSISHNIINAILEDNAGTLWIGTDGGGLNRLDRKRNQFDCYINIVGDKTSVSDDFVTSLYEDHMEVLWIGTRHGGLNRFDRETGRFTSYKNNPDDPAGLSDNHITVMYEDRLHTLWIGTNNGGLNVFDRSENRFIRHEYNPDDPTSISNNRVVSICEDKTGGLWFGTRGGGINVYFKETQNFIHYKHTANKSNSLSDNMIWGICEDRYGILWIGTDFGGLNRFDRKRNTFTHYTSDPDNPYSISDNSIYDVYEDTSGVLWIGTRSGGLNKFDRTSGRFTHYTNNPDDATSLSHNKAFCIYEDHAAVLWIGCHGGGLNRFNRETEQFTRYVHDPENPHSLSSNNVLCIEEDRFNTLWVGTNGGGLNKFDRKNGQCTHYKSDTTDVTSLSSDFLLSLYEDHSGILWIGTNNGLNKFNREKNSFTCYTTTEGLPDNVIYDILDDDKGNLWISTNRGMTRFNPRTEECKNYDVNDGLQSNEFNTGTAFKNKNGEMFFGGINGFNAFFPDSITDNPHIPSVVITDFQIFNKSVPVGTMADGRSILEKTITQTEEIALSYKDNVFSFEFAALHFVSPANNLYAYMMEGLEKDWNYVGNRRYVSYSGLSPGRYVFRVKGSNNDGIWNENGISLAITIVPPYWRTWWFYTVCALLIIVSTVLGYRYRITLVKRRQKEKERLQVITDINSVLEHGNATVYRRRFDSNTYEYIGDGIKDITGYGPEEFTLSLWEKIVLTNEFTGNLAGMSIHEVFKGISDGTIDNYIMDFQFQTKSGEERWARDISTALRDESGACYVCLGIIIDITDRKQIEEELRVRNEEMTTDLNMAHEIQSAYLGRYIPYFPNDVKEEESILQFYHLYHPASSLAGDFFEIFTISDCEVGILICDVMGHGTRASLLTFYLRGLIEQLMPIASNTAVFLDNLNNGLHSIMSGSFTRIFATAFYCVANIKTGQLRYSNAGHPTPLLLRRNQGIVEVLQCNGNTFEPALGLCENYKYIANERTLFKNDIVFFFTDGLYEVMDSDGKIFTRKRLHESMQNKLAIPPDKLLDDVLSETQQFAGKTEFDDDICMITMYVRNEI